MRRTGVNPYATRVLLTALLTLLIFPGARLSAHVSPDTLHIRKADTTFVVRIDTLRTVEMEEPEGWRGAAIRTNLLWDGIAAPNLGFDFALGEHFSLGLNAGLKPWPRYLAWDNDVQDPVKWRHFLVAPELRWWPDKTWSGWFFGLDLLYAHYNLASLRLPFGLYPVLRDSRLQGNLFAAGLFAGHSWWLSEHWRIELAAGVAAGYRDADRYECARCGAQVGREQGPLIIPQLALNIAWNTRPRRQRVERIDIVRSTIETLVEEMTPPDEPEPLPDTVRTAPFVHPLLAASPVVRPADEYRPYTPDRVLRKEDGALCVYFPFDSAEILQQFEAYGTQTDNAPTLDEIIRITKSILADSTATIRCIQLVGFASVEGSPQHNDLLARNRAQALQAYIQRHIDVPDSFFDTVGGGEAWTELRDVLNDLRADETAATAFNLTAEDIDAILEILDSEPDPAVRESRMRRYAGGRVWRSLLGAGIRDLRNAGFVRIYIDF